MKLDKTARLELTKEEMRDFGYKVVDAVIEHFETQNSKLPVANASRMEMDQLFSENIPENPMLAEEVPNFVLENVMQKAM